MVHPVQWVDEKDKSISDLHQTCPGLSVDQSNSKMNILAFVSAISPLSIGPFPLHPVFFVNVIYISNLSIRVSKSTSQHRIILALPFSAWLPAEERVELVMVEALAAARRLCALHHRQEPARHVYLGHLVTTDKTVFLKKNKTTRVNKWSEHDHDTELSTTTNAQVTGLIETYKQLVVFWPFSVILCEAAEMKKIKICAQLNRVLKLCYVYVTVCGCTSLWRRTESQGKSPCREEGLVGPLAELWWEPQSLFCSSCKETVPWLAPPTGGEEYKWSLLVIQVDCVLKRSS